YPGTWDGVGLSPVSVVGPGKQATPLNPPWVGGNNRVVLPRENSHRSPPVLPPSWEPGPPPAATRAPSRSAPAWPLPPPPGPDDAGYLPPLRGSSSKACWTGPAPPR